MSLEQELRFCEENGMEVEVQDQENFKITSEDERLQAIREVRVKVESKEGDKNKGSEESSEVWGSQWSVSILISMSRSYNLAIFIAFRKDN